MVNNISRLFVRSLSPGRHGEMFIAEPVKLVEHLGFPPKKTPLLCTRLLSQQHQPANQVSSGEEARGEALESLDTLL